MQGRGVTNYTSDKPSHALTTKTTEFDDALLKHGIVTTEQVMLAKGASPEEAVRLAREKKEGKSVAHDTIITKDTPDDNKDGSDSSDDDSFEDDEFFARYREERMAQLGDYDPDVGTNRATVQHISRSEWASKVNETSRHRWVLVTLVDSSTRRQEILQQLHALATKYPSQFSVLTIEATDAIPNWPVQRVPALFAYRDGMKRKEWITDQQGKFPTQQYLERILRLWEILDETIG